MNGESILAGRPLKEMLQAADRESAGARYAPGRVERKPGVLASVPDVFATHADRLATWLARFELALDGIDGEGDGRAAGSPKDVPQPSTILGRLHLASTNLTEVGNKLDELVTRLERLV